MVTEVGVIGAAMIGFMFSSSVVFASRAPQLWLLHVSIVIFVSQ